MRDFLPGPVIGRLPGATMPSSESLRAPAIGTAMSSARRARASRRYSTTSSSTISSPAMVFVSSIPTASCSSGSSDRFRLSTRRCAIDRSRTTRSGWWGSTRSNVQAPHRRWQIADHSQRVHPHHRPPVQPRAHGRTDVRAVHAKCLFLVMEDPSRPGTLVGCRDAVSRTAITAARLTRRLLGSVRR